MSQRIRLISDFNLELFGRYLANTDPGRSIGVDITPFGQVHQALADRPYDGDAQQVVAIVWTRAESVLDSFRRAAEFESVSPAEALSEVEAYAELLRAYASRVRYLFVPSWIKQPGTRGYGLLDYRPGTGIAGLIAQANVRLAERLASAPNAFVLDAEQWIRAAGPRAAAPKLWFTSKVPYGNGVFETATRDIYAALDGLAGNSRRLIVLDLDGTLWSGVVGERGWQGLSLGGHDHVGEAHVAFQRALKSLTNRGIQLAIVSKNDESVALEAIDNHPEMILRRSDFAGWRISWDDKAANLKKLVADLNLGLQSAVFIDDSAIERARVRETLADVLVPEWPDDPSQFAAALSALTCFDAGTLTTEDRDRRAMYAAERERKASHEAVGSLDEWLATLGIRVEASGISADNIGRAAQLFNKTNQMNLATRRLSEQELLEWAAGAGRRMWTVRVADKFGDSGLTGIISVEAEGADVRIVDFLLSCRVMGRRVEESMLHLATEYARQAGAANVIASFRPTERNAPCLAFWRSTDFRETGEHEFTRAAALAVPLPACVTLAESIRAEAPEVVGKEDARTP